MSVALTGANGYVGSIIAAGLPSTTRLVRLVRRPAADDLRWQLDDPPDGLAERLAALQCTDLIHAAWDMTTSDRGHVERTCIDGSLKLLRAVEQANVSRVIFISSISAFDGARSVYGQAKRSVERAVLAKGGVVLRLGLVHGRVGGHEGGMFGTIRRSVRASRLVPMIGSGRGPQHLLDAARLQAAIRSALSGELDDVARPITLADEKPVAFRELVRGIAAEEGRRPILLPIPWRLLYAGLRSLETCGLHTPVRSDSVVSFVNADPTPDFDQARRLHL